MSQIQELYSKEKSLSDWLVKPKIISDEYYLPSVLSIPKIKLDDDWFLKAITDHDKLHPKIFEQGSPESLLNLFDSLGDSKDLVVSTKEVMKWGKSLPVKEITL